MKNRFFSCHVRALFIVLIVSSPILGVYGIPRHVFAQTTITSSSSEAATLLVDDVIQDLKSNDSKKALVHLGILNQQLSTLGNSSSTQFAKALIDDTTKALKDKDNNAAIVHLNLVKQQLTPNGVNVMPSSSTPQSDRKSVQTERSISTNTTAASMQPIETKIFNLKTKEGLTFPIRYAITGTSANLHDMSYSERYLGTQSQSVKYGGVLSMTLDSSSNGKLLIEVPRVLVSSPQVAVGGALVPAKETSSNSKVKTLVVDFHKGSSGIEIQDKAPINNNILESETSALSTYKSPKYGITSIQYPSNWTISENDLASDYNTGPDYSNVLHIIEFSPPNHPAFVVISVSDSPSASNLDNYLSYASGVYRSRSSSYQEIMSNTTSKLAGNPAYSLEFRDVPSISTENIEYTQLELGTIVSDGLVFYIDYRAESPSYPTFLPTVSKMINSLKIDKSAIDELSIARINTGGDTNRNSNEVKPSPSVKQPLFSESTPGIPRSEQPRSSRTDSTSETNADFEDGFQRGVKDAGRDLRGENGHGFDDSCPKGHTATFCDGYKDGYSERWHDTPENDS